MLLTSENTPSSHASILVAPPDVESTSRPSCQVDRSKSPPGFSPTLCVWASAAKSPCPDLDARSFPSVKRRSLRIKPAAKPPEPGVFLTQYAWKATVFSFAQRLVHARVPGRSPQ